ncbi:MAG: lamin tail domain-containing protein, partial [Verrucomicrobia bacterium]|nr:lamin tail domain-containing protein [Verrucomicrobiota bacterium]
IDLVHPTTFSGIIGETKKWITGRVNWINNQIPVKPFLSRHTGAPAKPLTILTTNGEVYYTVDGSDPRAPGGEPSQTAVKYSTPFAPPTNSHIVARALITNTNIWSPPAEAVFGNPSPRLTVSELMYHPSPYPDDAFDNNEYEYIELLNPHTEAVNLSGLRFTDGISFIFPDTLLDPGDHILLVKNRDAFESRYGAEYQVFGEYNGALDNSGEYVSIKDCHGASIIEFTYDDSWSPLTDGLDFALTPRRINTPARDLDEAGNWRTGCRGGSPGLANPDTSARPRVLINEILAHAEDPLTDQIELFNPGANSVDIGHWFLSDDRKEPRKYVIPAPCIISPGDFYTISETKFNSSSEQSAGFGLDADGEGIFIFSADDSGELTGYCHGFEFGASDSSTSVGRHLTSIGDAHFVAQSCRTFGGSNSPPRVGPAVITEIMYHPRNGREYVELHNITSEQIALFDPEHPDNTWRLSNAIEFEFPPYTIIPAHGFLVITDFDPEQEPTTLELFRAEYDVPQNTHILGPFAGKLDNSGESIILTKPGEFDDDADEQPRVLVERVDFNDHAPWPFASDGIGYALQRIRPNRYGNDPANWAAIQPSPGANGRTQETPTITIQPQDQTVIAGTKAILNFKLQTEENFTYQWRFNNENLTNATNAALVFERISTSHAGTYQAVALSPTAAVESRTAEIKVLQAATIFEQPHDVAVAKGGNCTLSIVAAGNGELSYQWHHNGTAIPGATSPELEIRNAQSSDQGSYYVTITDAIGTIRSLTPAVAILTPPRILVSPVSRDVVEGNDVTSSIVTAGTPPFGYQWRMNGDILDTRITHNNTCFFTLKNVTKNQSGFIDVIVTNHANTNAVSESVLLRVLDDNDHDGMPDEWEQNHGLDPDAKDAAYDNDGDSMSNIEEFHAGTNPTNKASRLALRINRASPQSLTFSAAAGRTYNVQYTDAIQPMHWSTLISIPAYPTNRTVSVSDPSAAPVRFYRIVTPYRETQ